MNPGKQAVTPGPLVGTDGETLGDTRCLAGPGAPAGTSEQVPRRRDAKPGCRVCGSAAAGRSTRAPTHTRASDAENGVPGPARTVSSCVRHAPVFRADSHTKASFFLKDLGNSAH